jgi:hypothetical protein
MKIIKVLDTKGVTHEVFVDDDYSLPNKIFVSQGYAWINKDGNARKLHRVILNATNDQLIDHKDGNGLNNTKENLRVATKSQNGANRKSKGVSLHKATGLYRAVVTKDYKQYVKYHQTEEGAREAYKKLHVELHGEFSPYYKELTQ